MRLASRLLQVLVTTGVTGAVYVLAVVAWTEYFRAWDPVGKSPDYHLLKQISWLTAPVIGGIACGLTSSLFRRANAVVVSGTSSLLIVLAFSVMSVKRGGGLVWLDPQQLVSKAYWQCFAVLLPASAIATAWLVSRLRARHARRRTGG